MNNEKSFKTVTIKSSRFGWGLLPEVGSEDVQKLTINNRGGVSFTAYGWKNNEIIRKQRLNIGRDKAKYILDLLYGFVTDGNIICEATDVSCWSMEATAEDGTKYDISGPVGDWVEYNGVNISDLIRRYIPIENLIVFGLEDEDDDEMDWDGMFYRNKPTDKVWWLEELDEEGYPLIGPISFSIDKKKVYNIFQDYPQNLSAEEKAIFDEENPYWVKFFETEITELN